MYWEQAPELPELDEMTELNDGISVTNQRISRDSGNSLYFYVDLQDELAELRAWTLGVAMVIANYTLLTRHCHTMMTGAG